MTGNNQNVARQRNTVAMSNSYKTPDFTISMNGENQQNNHISAIGHNYRTSSIPQPPMSQSMKGPIDAGTAGFKDLTS